LPWPRSLPEGRGRKREKGARSAHEEFRPAMRAHSRKQSRELSSRQFHSDRSERRYHTMRVLLVAVIGISSWVAAGAVHAKTSQDLKWSDHYAHAKREAAESQRPLLVVLENPQDPAGRLSTEAIARDE